MKEILGKNIVVFYLETDNRTYKKSGVVLNIDDGLLFLDEIKEGKIVIPISRIGKFEVLD